MIKFKSLEFRHYLLIIIGVLLLINLIWVAWFYFGYKSYFETLDKQEYIKVESTLIRKIIRTQDGFTIGVKRPDYISTIGNISLSEPLKTEEYFSELSIIIWPKLFGGFEYGVIIKEDNTQFYINYDEKYNVISNQLSEYEIELFENRKEEIINYTEKVHKIFNIN